MSGQTDSDWGCWGSTICRRNVFSPSRELCPKVGPRRGIINGTINFPAKGVNRIHGISPWAGEKEEGVIKVTPTLFCRGSTVSLGFSRGHRICSNKGKIETVGGGSPLGLGYFTIALLHDLKKAANNQCQVSGFKFHLRTLGAFYLAGNKEPETISRDISLLNGLGYSEWSLQLYLDSGGTVSGRVE